MREDSPGLATSLLLYLPLAIVGYTYFVRTEQASLGTAISAALLGSSYDFITA